MRGKCVRRSPGKRVRLGTDDSNGTSAPRPGWPAHARCTRLLGAATPKPWACYSVRTGVKRGKRNTADARTRTYLIHERRQLASAQTGAAPGIQQRHMSQPLLPTHCTSHCRTRHENASDKRHTRAFLAIHRMVFERSSLQSQQCSPDRPIAHEHEIVTVGPPRSCLQRSNSWFTGVAPLRSRQMR